MPIPADIAALFPYPVNWSSSVTEVREYLTDIMRSRDGTEQRRAMRSKPRKTFSFSILLAAEDAANFDYQMHALQPHIWLLPLWHRQRRLAATALTGSNALQFDQPLSHEAQDGDYLVLLREGQAPEVQQIDSLAADRLSATLVDVLEADWHSGCTLCPAEPAQLRHSFSSKRLTSGVIKVGMDFSCLVDKLPPQSSALVADETIGGLEVLSRSINWAQAPTVGHGWAPQIIDAQVGPTAYETDGDISTHTRKGEVLVESRDTADWWLAFFDRVRGRQVPFLMPTWFDLHLQPPVTPGATFEVPGIELGTYLGADTVYTHLMVRLQDGTLAFYEIVYLTANAEENVTVITTTESWAHAYGPWTCTQASLVTTCRLASDSLEINWITDEVAKITLAVQTVEAVA